MARIPVIPRVAALLAAAATIIITLPIPSWAGEPVSRAKDSRLAGAPEADSAWFNVWSDKASAVPKPGRSNPVIRYQANRDGYLLVLAVSKEGDVSLTIPGFETADSRVEKGKIYSLNANEFPDWLRRSKSLKGTRLMFFVTPRPFKLAPLWRAHKERWLTVRRRARGRIRLLRAIIRQMAQEHGANQVVLELAGTGLSNARIRRMGFGSAAPTSKGLFEKRSEDSELPGSVTGTQGQTDTLSPGNR